MNQGKHQFNPRQDFGSSSSVTSSFRMNPSAPEFSYSGGPSSSSAHTQREGSRPSNASSFNSLNNRKVPAKDTKKSSRATKRSISDGNPIGVNRSFNLISLEDSALSSLTPPSGSEPMFIPSAKNREGQRSQNAMQPSPSPSAKSSKRGVSGNHLLSFTLPDRLPAFSSAPSSGRRKKQPPPSGPWVKERFINANFNFVLRPDSDYTTYLLDSDVPVAWDAIVQVIVPATKPIHCPICLGPPVCPQLTKCGHIYCWPCLLRYINLGDRKWRKCPICYDAIYAKDLKNVRFDMKMEVASASLSHPAAMRFHLMKRRMDSVFCLPLEQWEDLTRPPDISLFLTMSSCKLYISSWEYERGMRQQMRTDLMMLRHETEDQEATAAAFNGQIIPPEHSEVPSICLAIKENAELMSIIGQSLGNSASIAVSIPRGSAAKLKPKYHSPPAADFVSWFRDEDASATSTRSVESPSAFSSDAETAPGHDSLLLSTSPDTLVSQDVSLLTPVSPSALVSATAPTSRLAPETEGFYFFFQLNSGLHYYLHPLDIKILKHEFGSYSRFPAHLDALVIHVQESTMTEEFKKRYRFLSHLPVACDVYFCELDLAPLISPATFKYFSKEINARIQKYKQATRKENKRAAIGRQSKPSSTNVVPQSTESYSSVMGSSRTENQPLDNYLLFNQSSTNLEELFSASLPYSNTPPALASQASTSSMPRSFAKMAIKKPVPVPSVAITDSTERGGWTLDLEEMLEQAPTADEAVPSTTSSGKQKQKFKPLFSNGSQRRT